MDFGILGPVQASEGDDVVALGGAKQRALLALLLLHANEPVSMDRLVDVLWPRSSREEGVRALHVAVSRLRRVLGADDVLVTRAPGYELRVGPGRLDAERFVREVDQGRRALAHGDAGEASRLLHGALGLWRGPPLADLAFQDACRADITRLEELRVTVAEDAVEADLRLGRHAELVGDVERLVAEHPTRERPRCQLMLALYRSGRQGEALEAFRAGRAALVEALGVEPGRELQELHRRILEQDPGLDAAALASAPPPSPTAAAGGFVGRDGELASLEATLAGAFAGRGAVVLVRGEPGIGKSGLLRVLRARARERGAVILSGRCWEAGGAPAFWPWIDALRPHVATCDPAEIAADADGSAVLSGILPELRARVPGIPEPPRLAGDETRFQLFEAVARLLRRAAASAPLVLTLDDLHVADVPSILLLRFLARELEGDPVVLVGAFRGAEATRDEELVASLAAVAREPGALDLELGGLAEGDVGRLMAAVTGEHPADAVIAAVHARTDGNPLFVAEMTRLAATRDDAERDSRTLPAGVREVIRERLRSLPPGGSEMLTLAALLGREVDLDALAAVAGQPADVVLDALEVPLAMGVIVQRRDDDRGLRFSHVLVRDALDDALASGERMRLHARIAETLERFYGDTAEARCAQIAHHFARGGRPSDRLRAADFARRAGDHAVDVLAFEEAVRLYGLGIRALPEADEHGRADLLLLTGEAWARAGDSPAAKSAYLEAASLARRAGAPEIVARAAIGFGGRTLWPRAATDPRLVPALEDAARVLGDEDHPLRVQVLARLATAVRGDADPQRRDRAIGEAVAAARRLGDTTLLAYAIEARCLVGSVPERLASWHADADEVVRLAEEVGDAEREFAGRENRFYALATRGDLLTAKTELPRLRSLAERLRQPAQQWMAESIAVECALYDGSFDEAEAGIASAFAIGLRAVPWNAHAVQRLHTYVLLRLRGRLEAFEPTARASAREYPDYPVFACVLADVLARIGAHDEARGLLAGLAPDGFAAIGHDEMRFASMALLGEVAATAGDRERARAIHDELLPFAGLSVVSPIELCLDSTARVLGRLAAALGRFDEAAGHFDAAAAHDARLGSAPWLAVVERDRIEALR